MKNIFVGNLDFAATESSIRSLFEPYGQVDRVNLVTDRDTGRSRGFAFVEMTDSAAADRRRSVSAGRLQWNCGTWDSTRSRTRGPTSLTALPTGNRPFTSW